MYYQHKNGYGCFLNQSIAFKLIKMRGICFNFAAYFPLLIILLKDLNVYSVYLKTSIDLFFFMCWSDDSESSWAFLVKNFSSAFIPERHFCWVEDFRQIDFLSSLDRVSFSSLACTASDQNHVAIETTVSLSVICAFVFNWNICFSSSALALTLGCVLVWLVWASPSRAH